jgi:hypothetical protein
MANSEFVESCFCCGCILLPTDCKRRKKVRFLLQLLEKHWETTPFVWSYVHNMCQHTDKDVTISACMACIHWVSRSTKSPNGTSKLLLDSFILFCQQPLHYPVPDNRIMRRFVTKITKTFKWKGTEYHNPYKRFFAPYIWKLLCSFSDKNDVPNERNVVQTVARCSRRGCNNGKTGRNITLNEGINRTVYEKLVDQITLLWWEEQGQPLVFRSKTQAKLMRRALSRLSMRHFSQYTDVLDTIFNHLIVTHHWG